MGNVFSCCHPCERQDEGQRLLHEGVPSPQNSQITDCTTPESSETPSPADEKMTDQLKAGLPPDTSEPELVSGQAAVQVETDVLATPVKPDAAAVGNNAQVSAVDNSTLVDQQEAAAEVVLQVLADARKIVSASGEGGAITSLASQTLDRPSGGDESLHVCHGKAEIKAVSMEKPEGASTMINSQVAVTGVESQSVSTPIESPNVSTDKVESLGTFTASYSQAEGESGRTMIKSQAVPTEKLECQDTATAIENHAAAPVSESQAATENLNNHVLATVIDSQATSTITDNQAISSKIVPEAPGCSVKMEAQHSLAKSSKTISGRAPEKKEAFAELQQVPVVHSNGFLAEGVLAREKAEDVILPQEPLSIIKPAVMEVSLLTQNSSAEENEQNKSLNETPKGLSPTPETHVQFGLPAQQGDPSAARDGEPEKEQEVTCAVSDVEDKLAERVPPHSRDGGHEVSVEGTFPESDLELSSPPADTSASVQDSKEKKRTDGDSKLMKEPCNGEDISVTSEKEVHTEMRETAADSDAQDVVGLTTVSSLEDLLEDKGLTKQDEQDVETKNVTSIADGELASSPQEDRPENAGQLSPVESDGNEINCEEDLYRGEEEIEEEQEKNKAIEMTVPGLEDRCSLEPPMAILTYSEREWKGQTTKSAVIRKGYALLSQSFGCLRRVRGDNYCALRATLYQALMNTTQLPDWLQQESFLLIPEELEARYGLIKGWRFPDICKQINGTNNAVDLLKHYLSLLLKWWHEAATSSGPEGHMRVCDELFQGGVDEFGLMEALKLLMLSRAVELHTAMQSGEDVPIFCWLLFARDTSSCPRTLVANHLSQMGFSGGLEQVEMFLLGYALCHTIKAYRLYRADTEEFITHYPDDHLQDWPCLCLVTEDDRHYNVVVGDSARPQEDLSAGLQ